MYDIIFNKPGLHGLMMQAQELKMPEHNHSMSNFGLVFFLASRWAEFVHVVSNFIENHSPVFFSLVCASFSSKNVCQKLSGAFSEERTTGGYVTLRWFHCSGKQKVLFVSHWSTDRRKHHRVFLHTFLLENEVQTSEKKIQGCDFPLNWRPHTKIQLIWRKKKNRPRFNIEWLYSDVFN